MLKNFSKRDFTATNILIIITVLTYIIQINIPKGGLLFGLNLYFLIYDFWWQPFSTIFAHGGIAHLGMNMFVLWQFGNLIERFKDAKELMALYLISGLLTSILSFAYIFNGELIVSSSLLSNPRISLLSKSLFIANFLAGCAIASFREILSIDKAASFIKMMF